jgi:Double-stranded RNA binding motif
MGFFVIKILFQLQTLSSFVYCVLQVFKGVGSTKKQAKHLAAEKAVEYLTAAGDINQSTVIPKVETDVNLPTIPSQAGNKNPVSLMNEINQTAKYSLVSESGESHNKMFIYSVEVDGQIFNGSGKNKRLAKAHAAQNALQSLYGITFFSSPGKCLFTPFPAALMLLYNWHRPAVFVVIMRWRIRIQSRLLASWESCNLSIYKMLPLLGNICFIGTNFSEIRSID